MAVGATCNGTRAQVAKTTLVMIKLVPGGVRTIERTT